MPMSIKTHVILIIRSCSTVLWQISGIRSFLSHHALLTLIRALIVSKVDYCNSVLSGISGHVMDMRQSVLNAVTQLFSP